ncbi:signal transduction histidine kinase [Lipingzhangella halophila]|uniref:histidine kinase n=1 Tax=Lipingzhangella halophila TaxID=1783352 RepID=A0A7W7RHA1_9ACTN|nr:sensor domain-containing protein [Lipingzhangella halophila]MBB4931953.1 signal transduction histidine kinase [Lipingzhangella halophila]
MNTQGRPPQTPLEALRQRRFLYTRWPWRSLASAGAALVVGGVAVSVVGLMLVPLIILGEIVIEARQGIVEIELWLVIVLPLLSLGLLLALGPLLALPVAVVERWRLRLVHPPIRPGHRAPRPGLWSGLRTRYTDPTTWREFAYLLLLCFVIAPLSYLVLFALVVYGAVLLGAPILVAVGEPLALNQRQVTDVPTALLLVPVGAVLLLASPYAAAVGAHVNAVLGRNLLGGEPAETLRAELVEVTRSRARLVDAFEAERRRIERDLHDGAQQRLVALVIQLGLARMDAPAGSRVEETLASAHEQTKELISAMQEIIHGIHPQLLADQGLAAALPELVERSAIPVALSVDLVERPPSHVESTVYFAAAEALANVAKHTQARRIAVAVHREGETLVLEVTDDGPGGADPGQGTGLTGLADRITVIGGRMLLSSPAGGPTRIRVETPCNHTLPSELF